MVEGRQPLTVTLGQGQLIPGFEKGLVDMTVGETKTIEIEPTDAYGNVNEEMYQEVEKTALPEDIFEGMMLQANGPQGVFNVLVKEIKEMKFIPTIREDFGDFEVMKVSKIKHILSHRVIHATFYIIALKESGQSKKNNIFEVEINRLVEFYSLPRLITKFMESKDVSIYFIK